MKRLAWDGDRPTFGSGKCQLRGLQLSRVNHEKMPLNILEFWRYRSVRKSWRSKDDRKHGSEPHADEAGILKLADSYRQHRYPARRDRLGDPSIRNRFRAWETAPEFMQPRADVRAPKTLGPANAQQPTWLARHASDGILKRLQLLEQIFQFAVVPLPERRSC